MDSPRLQIDSFGIIYKLYARMDAFVICAQFSVLQFIHLYFNAFFVNRSGEFPEHLPHTPGQRRREPVLLCFFDASLPRLFLL